MRHATDMDKRVERRLPARPLERPRGSQACPYRILDISRSGCLVESSKPLGPVAASIPLELPVPARTETPVVRAAIVWEGTPQGEPGGGRAGFRYGLSFLEMDPAGRMALARYLDFLRRNHHLDLLDEAWRRLRGAGGRAPHPARPRP